MPVKPQLQEKKSQTGFQDRKRCNEELELVHGRQLFHHVGKFSSLAGKVHEDDKLEGDYRPHVNPSAIVETNLRWIKTIKTITIQRNKFDNSL